MCCLLCVVCSKCQQQSAKGKDEKNGEDFAGECQRVFHNAATVTRCVLSCQIKKHGGANFFSAPSCQPLAVYCAMVSAIRLRAIVMDASAALRSISEGSRFPAAL